ncbi:MAG TPA: hypothetical protein VIU61_12670 [Kofleriaceae bacterium]
MLRHIALTITVTGLLACGRSRTTPDEQLGGLVVAGKKADSAIDVDRAAKDPAELGRALGQRYSILVAALGPHVATVETKLSVVEGQRVDRELTDRAVIEIGDAGKFHGVYTNSADYGREAIFSGGKLYLRPRYQRWHGRLPETPEEPITVRDDYYSAVHATWELFAPGIELVDRGAMQVGNRPGRKIEIKKTPTPRKPETEKVTQRTWREGRTVEAVSGEIVIDSAKGVPLSWKLDGSIGFTKDGKRYSMRVGLTGGVSQIGVVAVISAPAENEVVATPGRLREVEDRDQLLHGIAPPLKTNPDGTSATLPPDDKVPPAPAPDKKSEDKKSEGKKSDDKKSSDDKSDDKKSDDKKSDDKKKTLDDL